MPERLQRVIVRSDKDTHFTGALNQNVSANANLTWAGGERTAMGRLREAKVWSDQNLAWELQLFKKDTFGNSTDLDLDSFCAKVVFAATDGSQNDGAGNFYYHRTAIDARYEDLNTKGQVHLKLVNRSAGAKNAGATGEIVVELEFEVP